MSGVGDVLALFRCISCRYGFGTDASCPELLGAPGRVFTSGTVSRLLNSAAMHAAILDVRLLMRASQDILPPKPGVRMHTTTLRLADISRPALSVLAARTVKRGAAAGWQRPARHCA